jgi:hypothetical protein
MSDDDILEPGEPREDDQPPSGSDELLYSIGEALRFKQTKEAIASLVQKFAEDVPNRSRAMRRAFVFGHLMTVFVVLAIGTFGYLKIISTETAGALLGAVVGGLYYSHRR